MLPKTWNPEPIEIKKYWKRTPPHPHTHTQITVYFNGITRSRMISDTLWNQTGNRTNAHFMFIDLQQMCKNNVTNIYETIQQDKLWTWTQTTSHTYLWVNTLPPWETTLRQPHISHSYSPLAQNHNHSSNRLATCTWYSLSRHYRKRYSSEGIRSLNKRTN